MNYNTKQKVVRRLNAAAKYMEVHGYCKGNLEDDRGRVCAYGAIEAATTNDDLKIRENVAFAFSNFLRENFRRDREVQQNTGQIRIFEFNDKKHRRGKDVIKALRTCAKQLKAPGKKK